MGDSYGVTEFREVEDVWGGWIEARFRVDLVRTGDHAWGLELALGGMRLPRDGAVTGADRPDARGVQPWTGDAISPFTRSALDASLGVAYAWK